MHCLSPSSENLSNVRQKITSNVMLFGCPEGVKITIFRGPHVRLIFDQQNTDCSLKKGFEVQQVSANASSFWCVYKAREADCANASSFWCVYKAREADWRRETTWVWQCSRATPFVQHICKSLAKFGLQNEHREKAVLAMEREARRKL